jgi:hypothetical protein
MEIIIINIILLFNFFKQFGHIFSQIDQNIYNFKLIRFLHLMLYIFRF